MVKELAGNLEGKGKRIAIVLARFNEFIGARLLEGAIDCLTRHGVADDAITVCRVPGAFELPAVALKLAAGKKFDAVICLGAVIRGATPHFEYVASESAKGIAQAALQSGIPIAYGVITADSVEQAIERAGTKSGNRGWDAALSALEMSNLKV